MELVSLDNIVRVSVEIFPHQASSLTTNTVTSRSRGEVHTHTPGAKRVPHVGLEYRSG